MDEIKTFGNTEFGAVKTLTINDEPWFIGKDVAEVLGYGDTIRLLEGMGGCTPTGFKAIRNTIGSGKNKTSITHLELVTDEKEMVQQIFKTFRQCRSINKTATIIGKDYKTKLIKVNKIC